MTNTGCILLALCIFAMMTYASGECLEWLARAAAASVTGLSWHTHGALEKKL
jgi:hypothetical protein